MQHLLESRVMEYVWDGISLVEDERGHLQRCHECRRQVAWFEQLRDEFAVAQACEIGADAEERLVAIFAESRQPTVDSNLLQEAQTQIASWVNALPLWDSRQQATAGVRSGSRSSYRMLFGAYETEVELMVEPQDGFLRIVGEVMVGAADKHSGLALIELMRSANAKSAMEAESDSHGRFAFEHVPPGIYVMTVIPRFSQMVVIEPLELT